MKTKIYTIVLLLVGNIFSSRDSDELEYQNEFKTSQKAWSNFKESTNNSYKYTVANGSWVGIGWETTITVENGIIIQRDFEYLYTEHTPTEILEGIPEDELKWTETENEIGTHEKGAEPILLDEIYNKAQQEWLIERENVTTYFENENNGMISTCGYVENNCADDCFIGITIKSIEVL